MLFILLPVKVFETVATTNASGNTHGETNYSIDDDISNISKKAIIYYRVKLVDIDNQFSLSNVVHVKLVEAEIDATVYPSPFTQYVNVLYTSELDGQVNIKMMDMNGNMIEMEGMKMQNQEMGRHVGSGYRNLL